jgi:D-alanyl-D-alanine carboxypeptidase
MKVLSLLFALCCATLWYLVTHEKEVNAFADGHLACAPLPPAFRPPAKLDLEPPPREITSIAPPPAPVHTAVTKIQLTDLDFPPDSPVAASRFGNAADWGIPQIEQPAPIVIASAAMPKQINIAPTPTPVPTPAPLVPNLYLPEGALNEEGAQLTLIKSELSAYEEPDTGARAAPFTMKEGDKVRPLTRLRNENDFDWIKIERDGKTWWAQAEYFIRVDPRNRTSSHLQNLAIGSEAVDKDSALPTDYQPSDMVGLPREYILDSKEVRLRRESADSLARMIRAADRKGLHLKVVSGFRDFNYQKKLYLEAIEKHGPKQNSVAAPGYSEHQLGTTVDVSNADRRFVLSGQFAITPEGRWLAENAEKFGFRNSYTRENSDEVGYRPEPWHFRYIGASNTAPSREQIAGR